MKYTEEEKKDIEMCNIFVNQNAMISYVGCDEKGNLIFSQCDAKPIQTLLNLLEKQKNEIERLYKDNYRLDRENQLKFERAVDTSDYVKKEKIIEKIKEIEERIEEENEMLELNQICKEDYESRVKYLNYALNIYKRLLGDE